MTENDWYRLRLELEEFDETPFVAGLERHRESGISFADFTSLGDSDDNRRKLFELHRACSRDIPNRGDFYTFEEYVAQRIEMTGVRARYRQRGISLAMKVIAFKFARAAGAATIRTFHSHENTPVIRANEKQGFRPAS